MTNSELLAIIIKTGKKNLSCLELAQNILKIPNNTSYINELEYLSKKSINELKKFDGIGRVKAIQIKAVLEISKRLSRTNYEYDRMYIKSPRDVFNLLEYSYKNKNTEILKTILLDNSNKVISIITNSIGKINMVSSTIKEIFSEPLKQMASGIILVHNHPASNMVPSKQDINFTNQINEYAYIFGFSLLDHIIIGNGEYISLKELGFIDKG